MNTTRWSSGAVTLLLTVVPLGCGPAEGELDDPNPIGLVQQSIHSWGNYHWARTITPFSLQTLDSVTAGWNPFLATTVSDWSVSTVLDLVATAGDETSPSRKKCWPTLGKVRVCNAAYGRNGWLGLAQVWVNGAGHITQGTAKMNDSYFTGSPYSAPAWKNLVMCQEVGHTLGLDHQDETSTNPNLGSCMDYTNNPAGPPSNEHPNQHDYDELELIYNHLDSSTTVALGLATSGQDLGADLGQLVGQGERSEHWVKPLSQGGELHTFVVLAFNE